MWEDNWFGLEAVPSLLEMTCKMPPWDIDNKALDIDLLRQHSQEESEFLGQKSWNHKPWDRGRGAAEEQQDK